MPQIKSNPSFDEYIGRQVRDIRLDLNMPQQKLAKQLGVSFQQVQKYERGLNRISASRLFHIALILGQDITVFYPPKKQ